MGYAQNSSTGAGFFNDSVVDEANSLMPDFADVLLLPNNPYAKVCESEQKLMRSVLAQALVDLQKYRFALKRAGQKLFVHAYTFIHSEDERWEFSFERICKVLRLNSDYVRRLVRDSLSIPLEVAHRKQPRVNTFARA